ncbi:four helix bundle protein [candidate division WWE3 bacterium CG08_land_8_20_14_0_20_41_15]|uniref:Four helix bundle protein n=1 Tax=candidate division WWE3 bacterium CG08_land_8_20_14_0_20_41_15 TaxID=1975086 RepID=A0A2H0XAJ2_UNCKA|nr:MAG: four helix bundle protein [candidate division WWE3 bacterium CG08_land_8_20_14_0_20_41_15]
MNDQSTNVQTEKKYDLEERTARFAEEAISLLLRLPRNPINDRLVGQATGSTGSLGANYCEANEAESKKDFEHKIGICKKETKESKHWIRLLATANPNFRDELRTLWKEAQELLLIFSKILSSARGSN